jgi:hypothetical protein
MPEKTPMTKTGSGPSARRWLSLFYLLPVLFVLGVCGYAAYNRATHQPPPVRKISVTPFVTVKINGLDAHLFAQGEALRASGNDLFIEFRDAQGKLADVGEVEFLLVLKTTHQKGRQEAILHSIGKVMRTATPGQYRTTLDPGLAGEWTATLSFSGGRGKAEASFPVKVL